MRINKLKPTLGIIALAISACAMVASAGNATMTVNIKGLKASEGALYVSVQDSQQFNGQAITAGGRYEHTKAGDKTFIYKDVPEGEYAIMLWHDLDNDGVFTQDEVTYMPSRWLGSKWA